MMRMIFNDFSIKEELLKILPMQERTTGDDMKVVTVVVNRK